MKFYKRPHYYTLNDNKEPIPTDDILVWGVWFGEERLKHAITTIVQDVPKICVSTIFLGIDHGFDLGREETYRPVLWETMIYQGNHFWDDQWRYHDYVEAVIGHAEAVNYAKQILLHGRPEDDTEEEL